MALRTGLIGVAIVSVGLLARYSPNLLDTAVQFAHNDQVHYGGHLLAGRVLSLWPCSAQLAETQYTRGLQHARTPRQVALLTTDRPSGLRAQLRETPALVSGVARHVSQRLAASA